MNIMEFAALATVFFQAVTLTMGIAGYSLLQTKVEVIRHEANSMKDQLVEEVRIASLAKGKLDEKNNQKDRAIKNIK